MAILNVALIFGGKSGEHEVSLRSAASVLKALDPEKYHVVPIGITKQGQWKTGTRLLESGFQNILDHGKPVLLPAEPARHQLLLAQTDNQPPLPAEKIDVAFPILHGTFGEDGTIQGLFEMAGIPYVGAGVLGSAVGMDKELMKRLLVQAGLPTPSFIAFLDAQWIRGSAEIRLEIERQLGYPCFVKPANMGSSVGISKAKDARGLTEAVELASQYDRKILVEQCINGREIECSVLGNDDPRASIAGEIIPCHEFYDYDAKYRDEGSQLLIPAPVTPEQMKQIQHLAVQTFLVGECAGMARVDFFLERETEQVLVNEINTIPGFTSISMYPKLWEASGLSYPQLIDKLIELALERHHKRQTKITSYT
jgi:D-alanine-D-alanine ligase